MIMMVLVMAALLQDGGAQATTREPRALRGLPALAPPRVELPDGEEGVVQATFFCSVGRPDTLASCRVVRQWPEDSRFGRAALRRLNGLRLRRGSTVPGDTFEFDIWACSDTEQPCLRRPWPEADVTAGN